MPFPPGEDAAAPEWYCLRAQPRHEAIAAAHLRRLPMVEVFCPRVRFQRPRRARAGYAEGGWAWATEAMFPGYLFARFDLAARQREIQHVHGVSGIVHFGGRVQPLPTPVIEQLRINVGSGGPGADPALATVTVAADPDPGAEVLVADGALGGLRAVVTRYLPARQRVRVLLEFMGREMEAELAVGSVVTPFVHPLRQPPREEAR